MQRCNAGRRSARRAVPEGIVEGLRTREDAAGLVQLDNPTGFVAGDAVRVRRGAFEECLGLIETVKDDQRVTILLDLLGRKVRVTIDAGLVDAA
jgi:transcriptional antiterminator RfaH